jgi:hypothetical protein
LRLLSEAASEKKDTIRNLIAEKFRNLRDVLGGAGGAVAESWTAARQRIRDAASRELRAFGYAALSALQATLETSPSAEVRARIEALLALHVSEAPFPIPAGEPLRRHRAIQVLERIGTPTAREILDAIARRSFSLRERREAQVALNRLNRQMNRE